MCYCYLMGIVAYQEEQKSPTDFMGLIFNQGLKLLANNFAEVYTSSNSDETQ